MECGAYSGATPAPLQRLESMLPQLDHERPTVVHCQGGYRSAIACSLLQRAGFRNVINLIGGFDAWKALGHPVTAGARFTGWLKDCAVSAPAARAAAALSFLCWRCNRQKLTAAPVLNLIVYFPPELAEIIRRGNDSEQHYHPHPHGRGVN